MFGSGVVTVVFSASAGALDSSRARNGTEGVNLHGRVENGVIVLGLCLGSLLLGVIVVRLSRIWRVRFSSAASVSSHGNAVRYFAGSILLDNPSRADLATPARCSA
jgi:hypothetical protein